MAHRIPARLTKGEGRSFGLTVGGAFLILAAISWWRGRHVPVYVLGVLGVSLSLAGLLLPAQLGPLYRAWMRLAEAMSKVTTPIFMSVVYFLILTPVALVMRAVRGSPIRHRAVNKSYWKDRSDARGTMANQF